MSGLRESHVILYVDDDRELTGAFDELVQVMEVPLTLYVANDCNSGESRFRELRPDLELVVLDYNIQPDKTGADLARLFLQVGFTGLLLGASCNPDAKRCFREAGVTHFCVNKLLLLDEVCKLLRC